MPYPIRVPWQTRPGWSEFGAPRPNLPGGKHNGFDYYCPELSTIYATGPGRVTAIGTGVGPNSFGNYIRIAYDDGVAALYAHMAYRATIPLGSRVTNQTQLGLVGHTGSAALVIWDGLRHVHEELAYQGHFIDPILYHQQQDAALASLPTHPLEEEDMTSKPDYIATTESGAGYALIDSNYIDGCIVTADVALATKFSWLAKTPANGGNARIVGRAEFNAVCAAALFLWRGYAVRAADPVAPEDVEAFADAVMAKIGPTLATDADLAAQKAEILAAINGVNANIDDQPTHFDVTPSA